MPTKTNGSDAHSLFCMAPLAPLAPHRATPGIRELYMYCWGLFGDISCGVIPSLQRWDTRVALHWVTSCNLSPWHPLPHPSVDVYQLPSSWNQCLLFLINIGVAGERDFTTNGNRKQKQKQKQKNIEQEQSRKTSLAVIVLVRFCFVLNVEQLLCSY